jgi:hypothetical protein
VGIASEIKISEANMRKEPQIHIQDREQNVNMYCLYITLDQFPSVWNTVKIKGW